MDAGTVTLVLVGLSVVAILSIAAVVYLIVRPDKAKEAADETKDAAREMSKAARELRNSIKTQTREVFGEKEHRE